MHFDEQDTQRFRWNIADIKRISAPVFYRREYPSMSWQKSEYIDSRIPQLAKASAYLGPFALPGVHCAYTPGEYTIHTLAECHIHRMGKPTKNSIFFVPSRRSSSILFFFFLRKNEKNNAMATSPPSNRKERDNSRYVFMFMAERHDPADRPQF